MVIWEFLVRPGMGRQFEAEYGPKGEWAGLFVQDKNYFGPQLIRSVRDRRVYLTLDFWKSNRAYESFRKRHAAAYKAIDARCEGLTESEREVGRYGSVG